MSASEASVEPPSTEASRRARTTAVGDPARIKLSWLVRLQWFAIVGQALTILAARTVLQIPVPLGPTLGIVAFEAVANGGLAWGQASLPRVSQALLGGVMLLGTLVMTALLALSGGPVNPFAMMLLVNVALATVLLDAGWAWGLMAFSLLAYGALFALAHLGVLDIVSPVDLRETMGLHLQGMWVAFVLAAGFIVYIVQRVQVELSRAEKALAAERSLSAHKDKVASLATLAAGAAHELSTPLSTIAVVVKELQRSLGTAPSEAVAQDLTLIREQVARCRDILHQMSAQAGENAGEPFVELSLARWVESTLEFLPGRARVQVSTELDLAAHAVAGPPRALARALRSLLKNALQASATDARVELHLELADGRARARVVDRGVGMPREVLERASEPFFTTKVPGEGMGLGLFLTQTLAEQLGGKLELRSSPGAGTTAILEIPTAPERRSVAT